MGHYEHDRKGVPRPDGDEIADWRAEVTNRKANLSDRLRIARRLSEIDGKPVEVKVSYYRREFHDLSDVVQHWGMAVGRDTWEQAEDAGFDLTAPPDREQDLPGDRHISLWRSRLDPTAIYARQTTGDLLDPDCRIDKVFVLPDRSAER